MNLSSTVIEKILAFLTGKRSNNSKALTAMRSSNNFVNQTPYRVTPDDAWDYMKEHFNKELGNFGIDHMDDLIYRAENYHDKYN